jgi:hypothetical protein
MRISISSNLWLVTNTRIKYSILNDLYKKQFLIKKLSPAEHFNIGQQLNMETVL